MKQNIVVEVASFFGSIAMISGGIDLLFPGSQFFGVFLVAWGMRVCFFPKTIS